KRSVFSFTTFTPTTRPVTLSKYQLSSVPDSFTAQSTTALSIQITQPSPPQSSTVNKNAPWRKTSANGSPLNSSTSSNSVDSLHRNTPQSVVVMLFPLL